MKKLLPIHLLLLIFSTFSFAQNKTTHQNLYWIRYYSQLYFSDKLSWTNEIENRRFFYPGTQNQLIAHTHLHYLINNNFEPAIGCTFSWQYAQEPEVGYKVAVPEIRPFQELTYHIPISKKLKFQQRLRLDERFQRNHTSTELTDGYQFTLRFRFRSQFSYKLKEKYIIKVSDEVMLNDRRNTFDQNRLSLSTEILLGKKFSVEVGYIHIYQERSNNKGYFSREVARLTLSHKIFTKKVA